MSKSTYNLGPAWVLTAENVTDPVNEWKNLGFTQGNVVANLVPGRIITNRVDQLGMIGLAGATFQHPNAFELTFPLVDQQIDVLLKAASGSVKLTGGGKEAFALPTGLKKQEGRAFCIVPVGEFSEDLPWWNSPGAIYLFKGIANVSNRIRVFKEPEENDLGPYEVTVTHLDEGAARGGIGPIWTPVGGVNVVGLADPDSLEYAVSNTTTRTTLNGQGITTVRGLVDATGAINISGSSLTSIDGLEYALRAGELNVSNNSISQAHMSDMIRRFWLIRSSIGLAGTEINISGNNGVDADAANRISGQGSYRYTITGVSTTDRAFTVTGDRREAFTPGRKIAVEDSTGNNGSYTVSPTKQVIYDAAVGNTTVFVQESVSSTVADGHINDGLVGAGCTVIT